VAGAAAGSALLASRELPTPAYGGSIVLNLSFSLFHPALLCSSNAPTTPLAGWRYKRMLCMAGQQSCPATLQLDSSQPHMHAGSPHPASCTVGREDRLLPGGGLLSCWLDCAGQCSRAAAASAGFEPSACSGVGRPNEQHAAEQSSAGSTSWDGWVLALLLAPACPPARLLT
jgi:hypothetical protein